MLKIKKKKLPHLPRHIIEALFLMERQNIDKNMLEFVNLPEIVDDFRSKATSENLSIFEYVDRYQHQTYNAWWTNNKFIPLLNEYKKFLDNSENRK